MRIIGWKRSQCCSGSNATSKLSKFSWRIIRFSQRCRVNKNQSSFSKMHFLVLRYFALAIRLNQGGWFSPYFGTFTKTLWKWVMWPGMSGRDPIMVEEVICLFFSSPTFGQEFAKWRLCMEFGKLWHLLVFKGGDTHKVCTDRTRSGIRHSHSFQIWPKLILRLFCGSILLGLGWLCVQEIEELFHRATLLSTLHSTSPPSAARPRRGAIF